MKLTEIGESKPHLYLDMDGVQADFFTAWARIHDKDRYKEIGDKEAREISIADMAARGPEFVKDFFTNLDPLPGGTKLVAWLKANSIPFTILSAPLRDQRSASVQGKRAWLDRHNPSTSDTAKFDGNKERYAVTGGRVNLLIDDHKKYISRWEERGGIGILYRDDRVDEVISRLKEIYSV
jgi:hypothetical protein